MAGSSDEDNEKPEGGAATGKDRRRHRRREVAVTVREIMPESHVMRATSLGAGGFFCPDAAPRKIGSEVLIEVSVGSKRLAITSAKVVRSGEEGLGVGLEFTVPQEKLDELLEEGDDPE